jgi:ceroid-lipofuscinosis MFS transporter 7
MCSKWALNMLLVNLVEFVSESSRGLFLPSIYLLILSVGGDIKFMGVLTATYSAGRLVSGVSLGWLSMRYSYRVVYFIAISVAVVGNILYIMAPSSADPKSLLFISRTLVGFGAGNRSVCRANVATLTTKEDRLQYIAYLSCVIYLGYALTPGFGELFQSFNFEIMGYTIDKFTAPAFVLLTWQIVILFIIVVVMDDNIDFNDKPGFTVSHKNSIESNTSIISETASDVSENEIAPAIKDNMNSTAFSPGAVLVQAGLILFIWLNFLGRGATAILETISPSMFIHSVKKTQDDPIAVQDCSEFFLCLGIAGVVTFVALEKCQHICSDLNLLVCGFIVCGLGLCVMAYDADNIGIVQLTIGEGLVWSIGAPITNAVTIAAFSKMLGNIRQGNYMGLIGAWGSAGRIVFPLLCGYVSHSFALGATGCLCFLAAGAVIMYDTRVQQSLHSITSVSSETTALLSNRV